MEIGVPGIGPHEKNDPFKGTLRAGGGTLMAKSIFSTFQRDGLSVSPVLTSSCKYLQLA